MAITPTYICGAECGVGIGTAGTHLPVTSGSKAIAFSTTVYRSPGARSFRFNPAAGQTCYGSIDTLLTAGYYYVVRAYIRFDTLPNSTITLIPFGVFLGNYCGLAWDNATGQIRGWATGPIFSAGGVAPTVGRWYLVDMKIDAHANPWTIDVSIDGVALGQVTKATAASTFNSIIFGNTTAAIADYFLDDIVVTQTLADFPLGPGHVEPKSPNADGTHSFTAGDFRYGDAGANVATSATDVNTYLDEVPVGSGTLASDSIEQIVARTTAYIEVKFPTTTTRIPRGLEVLTAHHESGTGNHGQTHKLRDNNGATEDVFYVIANAAGSTSQRFARKCYATIPGGGAWTNTAFNNLVYRFGFSGDVNPIPKSDGVLLEVEFSDESGKFAATMTKATTSLSGSQSSIESGAIVANLQALVSSLVGVEQPQGVITAQLLKALATLQGVEQPKGVLTGTMTRASASMSGKLIESGTLNPVMTRATTSMAGREHPRGAFAAALTRAVLAASGAQIYSGALTLTALKIVAALAGIEHPRGALAASLTRGQLSLAGKLIESGVLVAALTRAQASLAGIEHPRGQLVGSL